MQAERRQESGEVGEFAVSVAGAVLTVTAALAVGFEHRYTPAPIRIQIKRTSECDRCQSFNYGA